MESYKNSLVMFDTTKLNLFMRNDSVELNKEKNIAIDDEEAPMDS